MSFAEPDVLVVIPTLNEARHICDVVAAIDADPAASRCRVVVADGGSVDGTVAIAKSLDVAGRRVEVIHNARRVQAAGINLAVERFGAPRTRYLVRLDAHAQYPDGFIAGVVARLETGDAHSCVVAMETIGGNAVQEAGRDLFSSRLGHGGARHRDAGSSGFVEHGHHAGMRIDAFRAVGGYDPLFTANEDAEFDLRFVEAGYRIFLDGALTIGYIPRPSIGSTARQFFRNGYYRTSTQLKHRKLPKLRQLAPMGLLPMLYACSMLAIVYPLFWLPVVSYVLTLLVSAASVSSRKTPGRIVLVALLAGAAHLGFSLGSMTCLWDWVSGRHHMRRARSGRAARQRAA